MRIELLDIKDNDWYDIGVLTPVNVYRDQVSEPPVCETGEVQKEKGLPLELLHALCQGWFPEEQEQI